MDPHRSPPTEARRGESRASNGPIRLAGAPLDLCAYPAETITNRHFRSLELPPMERIYLPPPLTSLLEGEPEETLHFIEDDNRGAILPEAVATLDGTPFYLSVKGVGSNVDPYSWRTLDRTYASELSDDARVGRRLQQGRETGSDRIITGELWLRGSPYGGQGLEHGMTALKISERADLTSIGGFLIAPVVKLSLLPLGLEEQLRHIHWYRKYPGRMVQELRLVPSNVRVYFHAKSTVGNNIRQVFDQFRIDTNGAALQFETNFLRTTVALVTLFARTLTFDVARGTYEGLDFHDVWLDKDAVVAPDGSVYFVDLEGIEPVSVEKGGVPEKIEDQIYRSLYELTFAYEQIEQERARRFGSVGSRKRHFEAVLGDAVKDDPFVRLRTVGGNAELVIQNNCQEESLYTRFRAVDR
jgi:hypothetical protein